MVPRPVTSADTDWGSAACARVAASRSVVQRARLAGRQTGLAAATGAARVVALTFVFTRIVASTLREIAVPPPSVALAAELAEPGREAPYISLYQSSWPMASVVVPIIGCRPDLLWTGFAFVGAVGAGLSLLLRGATARSSPAALAAQSPVP